VTAITGFLRESAVVIDPGTLLSREACKVLARGDFNRFMATANLLTPRQAADKIGVSYPTLKHWILAGRIRTVKTPGGHHRVPLEALEEFLPTASAHSGSGRISGRNQLLGSVVEVTIEGLLAKVVLAVGNQRVTAIITADAVRELALKPGEPAVALIKATEVMIGRP
jgi:molybdopterin-binding protein